jgi:8-oxo-dGTP diphosphatase
MNQRPSVGVAILIVRNNRLLLVRRRNVHGTGTWSTPGGHLEYGETPEQCAAREAKEEIGLNVVNIRFQAITNDIFEAEGKHYITLWMEGEAPGGEPVICAEYEIAEMGWFDWAALPAPLFLPFSNFLKQNINPPVS